MAAAQQGSGQSDNSLGFFWVIVAILIALLLIWYNWSAYIVAFLFKIKLLEIACLKPFTSHADDIGHWIAQASPDNVTFKQVQSVSDWIGQMIRYPITVLLFGLAWVMYVGAVTLRFRKTLTMERLLHSEKQLWPHMSAITHVNLVSENINEGNWAMAATPLQFADKHRMIKLERQTSTGPLLDKNVAAKIILDRALSNRVFALQLGRSWSGIDQLPEHTRALFAVFASFANYDGETARRLLASIAGSSKNGSVDVCCVVVVVKPFERVVFEHCSYT